MVGLGVRDPRRRWYCLTRHAVDRYAERCPAALTPLPEAVRFARLAGEGRRAGAAVETAVLFYEPEMVLLVANRHERFPACWVVMTALSSLYQPHLFGPFDGRGHRRLYWDFHRAAGANGR